VITLVVGDRVRLRYAPVGHSGTVLSFSRGKVEVRWKDLQLTTRHSLDALLPDANSTRKLVQRVARSPR
jgi:hypothetical protein